ncbi:MAG: hypothetical protein OXU69_01085 [Gemmatimonadota bacterium]|nr:hypothetical protein [Gemmatimonadota bacterium]MDE2983269.1 hypothetical protein [Gemmatimonadota bacterium]
MAVSPAATVSAGITAVAAGAWFAVSQAGAHMAARRRAGILTSAADGLFSGTIIRYRVEVATGRARLRAAAAGEQGSGGGRLDSLSATRGARWGARVGTVAGKMVASEVADVGRR